MSTTWPRLSPITPSPSRPISQATMSSISQPICPAIRRSRRAACTSGSPVRAWATLAAAARSHSVPTRAADRGLVRAQAAKDLLDRYRGSPAVQIAVIEFGAIIKNLTNGFTNNPPATIPEDLKRADGLTDYMGALGAAYTMLSLDMQA